MKRPISRVILSGVVGVVSFLLLPGGCASSACDEWDVCEILQEADPNNESGTIGYTEAEVDIAREAQDTGAELVYDDPHPLDGPRFRLRKMDEQATETANDSKSTEEGAALAREAQHTGAELEIKKINEQATETAVEAYTEEPRWDGASEYSQACSPSSGDLGCD